MQGLNDPLTDYSFQEGSISITISAARVTIQEEVFISTAELIISTSITSAALHQGPTSLEGGERENGRGEVEVFTSAAEFVISTPAIRLSITNPHALDTLPPIALKSVTRACHIWRKQINNQHGHKKETDIVNADNKKNYYKKKHGHALKHPTSLCSVASMTATSTYHSHSQLKRP